MNKEEFLDWMLDMDYSTAHAARKLFRDVSSIQKYNRGELTIPLIIEHRCKELRRMKREVE